LGGNHVQSISQPVGTTTANLTYSYDADGRVTNRSIDGTAETYGFSNAELTNVTNPLGSFAYSYDPSSARLTQITYPKGQKTNFTYYQPSNPVGSGRC
jgi:YD repeat-containing protein